MGLVYVVSVIAAALAFALAALWAFVGVAGLAGKLPGNRWAGVRTKETVGSREAWELAHRVAAPGFLGGAVALTLGGLLALTAPWGFLYALGGLVLGALAVSVVSGIAVRAAQTIPSPEGEGGCSSECCSGGDAADCGQASCGSCALSGMCLPESGSSATTGAAPASDVAAAESGIVH